VLFLSRKDQLARCKLWRVYPAFAFRKALIELVLYQSATGVSDPRWMKPALCDFPCVLLDLHFCFLLGHGFSHALSDRKSVGLLAREELFNGLNQSFL
jgi:hypothetical protein